MKVIIEYDETTGQLTDRNGANVGCWMGINRFGEAPEQPKVESAGKVDALALIERGWTPEEVLEARKVGLV